jgi:predicted DNA-binding transcriptional regulator YafY
MIQTSARLLSLLSLLQMRREWTGAELAGRLEIDVRTVRRDVDKLRSLGYPVESARGVAGGYRLGAGGELPPLLLDDAEAVAVAVGLRTAASGSIAGIEEASVRAMTKLEQLLPSRLRRRVKALGDVTSAFSFQAPDSRIDADHLTDVAAACRDGMQLRFAYVARDDQPSERRTEPAALVYSGWRWYLVAWDLDREDWRTFRVDRIQGRLGAVSPPRRTTSRRTVPGGDPAAYVRRQLQGSGETDRAEIPAGRIRIHAPAARVRGRVQRYATVEPDGEDACLVTTRGGWREEFVVWMATLGEPLEVLEPPEMRALARSIAQRLAAA